MRPVEIDTETLALDVIHNVGPGGDFIAEKHTVQHFRSNWFPQLLDRQNFDAWAAGGKATMGDRARQKVNDILTAHEPQALSPSAVERIRSIVDQADARLGR